MAFCWYQNHLLTLKLQAFTPLESLGFQRKKLKFLSIFKKMLRVEKVKFAIHWIIPELSMDWVWNQTPRDNPLDFTWIGSRLWKFLDYLWIFYGLCLDFFQFVGESQQKNLNLLSFGFFIALGYHFKEKTALHCRINRISRSQSNDWNSIDKFNRTPIENSHFFLD